MPVVTPEGSPRTNSIQKGTFVLRLLGSAPHLAGSLPPICQVTTNIMGLPDFTDVLISCDTSIVNRYMITVSQNVMSWKGPIRIRESSSELHRTPQGSHNVPEIRYYNTEITKCFIKTIKGIPPIVREYMELALSVEHLPSIFPQYLSCWLLHPQRWLHHCCFPTYVLGKGIGLYLLVKYYLSKKYSYVLL